MLLKQSIQFVTSLQRIRIIEEEGNNLLDESIIFSKNFKIGVQGNFIGEQGFLKI